MFPSILIYVLLPRVLSHVSRVSKDVSEELARAQWSYTMVTLVIRILLVRSVETYQLFNDPLSAFCQKFEIWVRVDIEDVNQLRLK